MPRYDYDCEKCQADFELFRGFDEEEPQTCPKCGKGPIKRRLSLPSIVFKGGGFYKNDSQGKERSAPTTTTTDSSIDNNKPSAKSDDATTKTDVPEKKSEEPATKKATDKA